MLRYVFNLSLKLGLGGLTRICFIALWVQHLAKIGSSNLVRRSFLISSQQPEGVWGLIISSYVCVQRFAEMEVLIYIIASRFRHDRVFGHQLCLQALAVVPGYELNALVVTFALISSSFTCADVCIQRLAR